MLVEVVQGSVRKVCQLTGEKDRQTGTDAFNQTETRFGLQGTDLGSSFEMVDRFNRSDGRLWFLFGDSYPTGTAWAWKGKEKDKQKDKDSVAWTDDSSPEPGIKLNFLSEVTPNGKRRFLCPVLMDGDKELDTGTGCVPVSGFSYKGRMYIFYTLDLSLEAGRPIMGRTVLAKAIDNDPTNLRMLYEVSALIKGGKFINIACLTAGLPNSWSPAVEGLPEGLPFNGPALLVWGSGQYRQSGVSFACVPLDAIEEGMSAWQFFAGFRFSGRVGRSLWRPRWSRLQSEAEAVVSQQVVGELSVTFLKPLRMWLMLYNESVPNKPHFIRGRVAVKPWGPWSDPFTIFDPHWPGLGYRHFIHVPHVPRGEFVFPDRLSDPGRIGEKDEMGDPYGPYLIHRYTTPVKEAELWQARWQARIYFLLSTWNPYNVVLMTAVISKQRPQPFLRLARLADAVAAIWRNRTTGRVP